MSCDIENNLAIVTQGVVGDIVFINGCEIVVIDDMDGSVRLADELQWLIDLLHLIVMGEGYGQAQRCR